MTENGSHLEHFESIIKIEPEEIQNIYDEKTLPQPADDTPRFRHQTKTLIDRRLSLTKSSESEVKCPVCPQTFPPSELNDHVRTHFGVYECKICGIKLQFCEDMRRHHLRKHSNKKLYECHCGAPFASEHALKMHKKNHSKNKKSCPRCRRPFPSARALEIHKKIHFDNPEEQAVPKPNDKFTPPVSVLGSSKNFGYRRKVSMQCDLCPRAFSQKDALISHMELHLKFRPLECSICQQSCISEWNLKTHTLSHFTIIEISPESPESPEF